MKTAGVPERACAQRRASPLTGGLRDIDKLKRVFTYLLLVCRAATSAGGGQKKFRNEERQRGVPGAPVGGNEIAESSSGF